MWKDRLFFFVSEKQKHFYFPYFPDVVATLHKYKSVTHKNEAFFNYFFGKFEQIQRIFSCFLNLRKIPCVVIKISIGLFKNNSLSLQPDMCNEELDIIWCIMWNYLPFNRNKQWESGADWVKISSFFNPLWTEVGGPMDPKRNSFVDWRPKNFK